MNKTTLEVPIDFRHDKLSLGIKVERRNNRFFVHSVDKGGTSDGKLFVGDELTHIDGHPLQVMSLQQFIDCVKGRIGNVLLIVVQRCVPEDHAIRIRTNAPEPREPVKNTSTRRDAEQNISTMELMGKSHKFEVIAAPGPLGVNIRKQPWDIPIGLEVSLVNNDSQCLGKIQVGDWIVAVNSTPVATYAVKEFGSLLNQQKHISKRLTMIRFKEQHLLAKVQDLARKKYEEKQKRAPLLHEVEANSSVQSGGSNNAKSKPPAQQHSMLTDQADSNTSTQSGGRNNVISEPPAQKHAPLCQEIEANTLTQIIRNNNTISKSSAQESQTKMGVRGSSTLSNTPSSLSMGASKISEPQQKSKAHVEQFSKSVQDQPKISDPSIGIISPPLQNNSTPKQSKPSSAMVNKIPAQKASPLATQPHKMKKITVENVSKTLQPSKENTPRKIDGNESNEGDSNSHNEHNNDALQRTEQKNNRGKGNASTDGSERLERKNQATNKSPPKCEICGEEDGHLGCMTMQECSACGIHVHESCYGLSNEHVGRKYANWKCHACASKFCIIINFLIWTKC